MQITKNIKTILLLALTVAVFIYAPLTANAIVDKGIYLQIEAKGEAWYVNPADMKRYMLGSPSNAFLILRKFGVGISEKDFENFAKNPPARMLGKVFLRVEKHGEAYYCDPFKRICSFLGNPTRTFQVLRNFGRGITNKLINEIPIGSFTQIASIQTYKTHSIDITKIESKLHELLNEERLKSGLKTLDYDEELSKIARENTYDLSAGDNIESGSDCQVDCRLSRHEYIFHKVIESSVALPVYLYKTSSGSESGFLNEDQIARMVLNRWIDKDALSKDELHNRGIGATLSKTGIIYITNNETIPIATKAQQTEISEFGKTLFKASDSEFEKTKKIHDYIADNISYELQGMNSSDAGDQNHLAYWTWKNKKGVCQGYSELMHLFLRSAGVRSYIIKGRADGYGGYGEHGWNKVYIEGKELYIDVTWDSGFIKDEKYLRNKNYVYYLIPKRCIALDHMEENESELSAQEQKRLVNSDPGFFQSYCPDLKAKILNK